MNAGKWTLAVLISLLVCGLGTAEALTGLGFGVRAGTTKLEDPNTGDSGDAMTMFGGHLKIGTLPIIDLEASAEYAPRRNMISASTFPRMTISPGRSPSASSP